MTEKEIQAQVTDLFNAIKANNDPRQREIDAAIVGRFLFNLERIADSLETLSDTAAAVTDHRHNEPAIRTRD